MCAIQCIASHSYDTENILMPRSVDRKQVLAFFHLDLIILDSLRVLIHPTVDTHKSIVSTVLSSQ